MNMTSSSSSAAAHVLPRDQYNVFLSFRGLDTRKTFTIDLYKALTGKNINTYMDTRLEGGDDIEYTLAAAIQQSQISIVVFSENYASSGWCLDELVHIVECKRIHGRVLLPVFYRIEPSHVRHQVGRYADAFVKHEKRFKNNTDKVSNWRETLEAAASLSGYNSLDYRPESALVDTIVKQVLKKMKGISSTKSRGIFGIEKQVQDIESLLSIQAQDVGLRIIGIWGMGGAGKTTLANEVFLRLSSEFDSCSFLRNVTEELRKYGIPNVRNKLEESLGIGSELPSKKVLVVLDNVSDSRQILDLLGDQTLRRGSRIIITSRDKRPLMDTIMRDNHIHPHQMQPLETDGALQLFHSKASKNDLSETDFLDLSRKAAKIAAGLPLVLKLTSSALGGCKTRNDWEDVLNAWQPNVPKDIEVWLRSIYNGLQDDEKEIFLDIACFFKGEKRGKAERMLQRHIDARRKIQTLIDKALISVSVDDHLEMHDLLQEMGRSIVRRPSIENRSRLWNAEDVNRVLRYNIGTERLEAICSDISTIPTLQLRPNTFENMPHLKLLRLYGQPNVHLPKGLDTLPGDLRYLYWARYPSESLPSKFPPDNLVELHLPQSRVKKLWNNKKVANLRTLKLKECKQLTEVPDFSQCPNMETLTLSGCSKLKFHKGYPKMPCSLLYLDLSYSELTEVPDLSKCPDIEKLNLHHCANLVRLPNRFLKHHAKLTTLNMAHCSRLQTFPEIPCSLRTLDLSSCSKLTEVPDLSECPNIEKIDLCECTSLVQLPNLKELDKLTSLELAECSRLIACPELPRSIRHLDLSSCPRLTEVPDLSGCPNIEEIDLCWCPSLEQLPELKHVDKLTCLKLAGCSSLTVCPELPRNIRQLDLSNCSELTKVPDLSKCPNIEEIDLCHCTMLEQIPYDYVRNLDKLTTLLLENCSSLRVIPKLPKNVRNLHAPSCSRLTVFPDISPCPNIERIDLSSCTRLVRDVDKYTTNLDFFRNPDIEIDLIGCTGLVGNTRASVIRKATPQAVTL